MQTMGNTTTALLRNLSSGIISPVKRVQARATAWAQRHCDVQRQTNQTPLAPPDNQAPGTLTNFFLVPSVQQGLRKGQC